MLKQIGQYKILNELGTGGMGVVYRALDTELGREVALKRLRSEFAASPKVLERFRNEAKSQSMLNHPNITQLYSTVQVNDAFCIVMEFVRGVTVHELLPLQWEHAVAILLQILAALECAHNNGVLHRDIKPENVLVDASGTVKVMDFGIAYTIGAQRMTREKSLVGTMEYMPPERILGNELTARSDIYSVGIMLFEMLSGRLPFGTMSEYDLLRWQVEQDAPPVTSLVDVPRVLEDVIARAMRKDPEQRYASCCAMSEELSGLLPAGTKLQSLLIPLVRERVEAVSIFDPAACFKNVRDAVLRGEMAAAENILRSAANRHPAEAELQHYKTLVSRAILEAERTQSPRRAEAIRQLLKVVAMEKSCGADAGVELARMREEWKGTHLAELL